MEANLHSPQRHLMELRMAHAELDAQIDQAAGMAPLDELHLRRLKKRRLALKDAITRLDRTMAPDEPA